MLHHTPKEQSLVLLFPSPPSLDPGVLPSLYPKTSTSGQASSLNPIPTLGLISKSLFRTTPQGATPMATTLLPPVLAVWWSLTATPTCRPMPVCSPPVTIQAPMEDRGRDRAENSETKHRNPSNALQPGQRWGQGPGDTVPNPCGHLCSGRLSPAHDAESPAARSGGRGPPIPPALTPPSLGHESPKCG